MTYLELIRLETGRKGTYSVMLADKVIFSFTLEPPDRLNMRNTSSIPTGQYECAPYKSTRFGLTMQVLDVPERTYILFHAGNFVGDTEGCIIVGSEIGKLKGNRAVLNSGATHKTLMGLTGGKAHLTIREAY